MTEARGYGRGGYAEPGGGGMIVKEPLHDASGVLASCKVLVMVLNVLRNHEGVRGRHHTYEQSRRR